MFLNIMNFSTFMQMWFTVVLFFHEHRNFWLSFRIQVDVADKWSGTTNANELAPKKVSSQVFYKLTHELVSTFHNVWHVLLSFIYVHLFPVKCHTALTLFVLSWCTHAMSHLSHYKQLHQVSKFLLWPCTHFFLHCFLYFCVLVYTAIPQTCS